MCVCVFLQPLWDGFSFSLLLLCFYFFSSAGKKAKKASEIEEKSVKGSAARKGKHVARNPNCTVWNYYYL